MQVHRSAAPENAFSMAHYAIDKTLATDELRFHYRDWNGHAWPTLLLHGLSATSHSWDLVAPLLSDCSRTVALDLRGHGRSDKPDTAYSFEEVGGDVLTVLEALQFERPVLVGYHWGANVALWVAATHPDRIGGLVMIDGGLIDLSRAMSWQEAVDTLIPPPVEDMLVEDFREQIVAATPQGLLSPAVEAAVLANYEIDAASRIHRRLPADYHKRILRALWDQHPVDLYDKLTCPTLIMPARGHDSPEMAARKRAAANEAERRMADGLVLWLDDTPQDAPLHRPYQVAEEICRFINEQL